MLACNGKRTGVAPKTSRVASCAALSTSDATVSARSAGQWTMTSSCWKKTIWASVVRRRRRRAARTVRAESGADHLAGLAGAGGALDVVDGGRETLAQHGEQRAGAAGGAAVHGGEHG